MLQRSQCVVSAVDRIALCVAVANFRSTCPPKEPIAGNLLEEIPGLLRRQRRARQMSRSIEAVSASSALSFLHGVLVSLSVLAELFRGIATSLSGMQAPDWSQEERNLVLEAEEFKSMLKGVEVLRRILWRMGLAADIFLPVADGEAVLAEAGDLLARDANLLRDRYSRTGAYLSEARSAWAVVERGLAELNVELPRWDPEESFEAAGSSCQGAAGANSTAPLCSLCLLPALPPFTTGDAAVASLWKGSLCHVQCANFWTRHMQGAKILSDLGIVLQPFA